MKRLFAILLSALLTAALFPQVLAEGGEAERSAVVYTGETVNAVGISAGGTFDWTLSVSEASRLFSGHWLVDYPEDLVTPVSASVNFAGSLTNVLNSSNTSDRAAFVYNLGYVGQSGSVPCGIEGEHYVNVGMYLTTFTHGGVQPGGAFIKITFRLDRMPTADEVMEDYLGSFFTIPVTVVESNYFVSGASIAPDSEYALPHETADSVIGKVYVYGVQPPAQVTLGDTDLNGTVDMQDALLTLRGAMGLVTLSAEQIRAADVDLNGTADINDALKILRFAMGLISSF